MCTLFVDLCTLLWYTNSCLLFEIRGIDMDERNFRLWMETTKNYHTARTYTARCIRVVNMGFIDVVMFNPVIVSKRDMYETAEGCLSLDGVRKTTRYQEIEVEYYDFNWKKQHQKLSGWTAQICQHEIDHLSGKII